MAFTPGNANIATSGMTAVTAVGSPASAAQRMVRTISVFNKDTITHTVTLQLFDGTNTWLIDRQSIPAGGRYIWGTGDEIIVLDTTSKLIQVILGEAHAALALHIVSSWADNS